MEGLSKRFLSPSDFLALCTEVPEEFIRFHLSRSNERYLESFKKEEIASHITQLASLSSKKPCSVLFSEKPDNSFECTVLAFDYPGVFSVITGILAVTGFDIISGNVFTYTRDGDSKVQISTVRSRKYRSTSFQSSSLEEFPSKRRRIIDRFTGRLLKKISFEEWKIDFSEKLREIFNMIEQGGRQVHAAVKQKINEMVVETLANWQLDSKDVLYPIHIRVKNVKESYTRMTVISQDTPFFLYSLSNALSLHHLSIENVKIETKKNRVKDEFEFTDLKGKPITDDELLNRIKTSVLFTKQFTYFLGKAPDPYAALVRFEDIIQNVMQLPSHDFWETSLSNPDILKDLAQLLGASDFLWEDFIRLQYENIIPMLKQESKDKLLSHPCNRLPQLLDLELESAKTREEEKEKLNTFKDRETYLIDLDHIINPQTDFLFLSQRLTCLAEVIVNKAVLLSWNRFTVKYGIPLTVAGLPATYTILGLGKLGGAALGYASDIEILFIYSDNGYTNGREKIGNFEFFERVFKDAVNLIETKREGIFRVDLRLRPYGNAGPIACSLESFCKYYGKDGQAHSYERLALVRMRAIGGDRELGKRVERIRDELIYSSRNIDPTELKELRQKQMEEKTIAGKLNAKFSPGALVDLEYTVQILQCMYGKEYPGLRTPRVHTALEELVKAGIMQREEAGRLVEAYHFFRRLINGLRMLRGSTKDLFLPDPSSDEHMHLARRMGYRREKDLSPSRILALEFDTTTATIRTFVEKYLGRESLPGPLAGNAADLVLSDSLPQELIDKILEEGGFKNIQRAYTNLKLLAGKNEKRRQLFAWLAVLAWDILGKSPDPDMALNNWERFVDTSANPVEHFRELFSQPKRLEILLNIFAGSQFLADTLVNNPQFFEWVSNPSIILTIRSREEIESDLEKLSSWYKHHLDWLNALRSFRKREILRIGTRDICLRVPIKDIVTELSNLADAIIEIVLLRRAKELKIYREGKLQGFCILAFGKLGGEELNYSSDIDLLGIFDYGETETGTEKQYTRLMELLCSDISVHTEEGFCYRVDLRLRPYGSSGALVHSVSSLLRYYNNSASDWEFQALLKLRAVAGDIKLGESFLKEVKHILCKRNAAERIVSSVKNMRRSHQKNRFTGRTNNDIKTGHGGIRDIEFLVQGLQLIHCSTHPQILSGNTLDGIESLKKEKLLPTEVCHGLIEDYLYLRRIEHFLQIFENLKTHTLPTGDKELEALSRRIEGPDISPQDFLKKINETRERVKKYFDRWLY